MLDLSSLYPEEAPKARWKYDPVMLTTEFKEAFWVWFDSLSSDEREKFNYSDADVAELAFMNEHYRPNPYIG